MKVVINKTYLGFDLSDEAKSRLWIGSEFEIKRNDPRLIQVVEELGERANGRYAKLKIVEIPDDVDWEIHDEDGFEWIVDKKRFWG